MITLLKVQVKHVFRSPEYPVIDVTWAPAGMVDTPAKKGFFLRS